MVLTSSSEVSCRPPKHEGERALFGDNDGVDSRAPGAATRPVHVVKPLSDKSDEHELIASILRKDRKAAARLVAAHLDAVYAYARHRLSPHADLVDDVVQDVFLAALKGLATFEGQSSLRTWLVAIARHKIEDTSAPEIEGLFVAGDEYGAIGAAARLEGRQRRWRTFVRVRTYARHASGRRRRRLDEPLPDLPWALL